MTVRVLGTRLLTAGLLTAATACGGGDAPAPAASPSPTATPWAPVDMGPPNILLIVADDLGYGDLGVYGNPTIRTPNLDRLASEGIRFTDFYVPAPICAPSRAGLLTGRWPPVTGIPWNPPDHLDYDEIPISSVLQRRGYATGIVGKWHLGWEKWDMPIHWGFDYYYGIPNGFDENNFILGDQPTRDAVGPSEMATRYTREAIRFITEHRDRFFMYVAHRDPHLPNFPAPEFGGRSAAGAYGDVIEQLDASIGDLLDALVDLGLAQNTLVIFTSDNGPVVPPGSAGPLGGEKFSCEEGGIRVPGIMRWPARIRPGRVISEPVTTLDLFPTFVAVTGATLPNRVLHGQNISPLLYGDVDRIGGRGMNGGRELLFWQGNQPGALRSGPWKLLRPGQWNTSLTLFNLENDPGERNELSAAHPDLVAQLNRRIDQIRAGE